MRKRTLASVAVAALAVTAFAGCGDDDDDDDAPVDTILEDISVPEVETTTS